MTTRTCFVDTAAAEAESIAAGPTGAFDCEVPADCAKVTLGRDGAGDDFDAWSVYVAEHIDAVCGFPVAVDVRGIREVQRDAFKGNDEQIETMRGALVSLWGDFCSEAS